MIKVQDLTTRLTALRESMLDMEVNRLVKESKHQIDMLLVCAAITADKAKESKVSIDTILTKLSVPAPLEQFSSKIMRRVMEKLKNDYTYFGWDFSYYDSMTDFPAVRLSAEVKK